MRKDLESEKVEEATVEEDHYFGGIESKPPSKQDVVSRIKKIGNVFSEDKNRTGRILRKTVVSLERTHSHILRNSSFLQSIYWEKNKEKFDSFLKEQGIKKEEEINKFIQIAISPYTFKTECWTCRSGEPKITIEKREDLSILERVYEYEPWCFLIKGDIEYRKDFRCERCIGKSRKELIRTYASILRTQDIVWQNNRILYLNDLALESYSLYIKAFWWSYFIRDAKEKIDKELFGSIKGICSECKNTFDPRVLQLHHEEEAYKYIGRENEYLHLLRWVCGPCHHRSIHSR